MSEGLKRVFGIDLGTTYSAIAVVDEHGRPVVLANSESERITPSVVLFDGENVIVGNTAKESSKVEPDRVVSRVKQNMGDPNFLFRHDGKSYRPEEISSMVLRKVVGDAQETLGGEPITDVVITCPAYFGTPEREATAQAGRLAGLNVRAILSEPTAAAIAYGLEQGEDQVVLVYDLGGGTFDVTLIEIKDRLIRVICTGGDHRLGGALWDEAIVLDLADAFKSETGLIDDPTDDPEVLNGMFLDAERAKKTLSLREKAPMRVAHAGQQVRVELTRERFEAITAHLLDRTLQLAGEMLMEAVHKGYEGFDKLILVGGATRMPQVRARLATEFGVEPESYDPDEAVAKGAALFGLREALQAEVQRLVDPGSFSNPDESAAAIEIDRLDEAELQRALDAIERSTGYTLTGPVRELVGTRIVNVLSKGLGVVARDDRGELQVVYLLPRNGEVPMERTSEFGTDVANQEAVEVRVVAGEGSSTDPADSQEVGVATLSLPPGLPARSPIRVTYAISRDGLLSVSATDLAGGGSIDVEFETESVMDPAQLADRSKALSMLHVS